jgi:hypothetical protein
MHGRRSRVRVRSLAPDFGDSLKPPNYRTITEYSDPGSHCPLFCTVPGNVALIGPNRTSGRLQAHLRQELTLSALAR